VVASALPTTGGAALEVDPVRVDDIARGIVLVATDDGLRSQLVTAGEARAGTLTWVASARAHVVVWSSLS
jgi:hypothetical protein